MKLNEPRRQKLGGIPKGRRSIQRQAIIMLACSKTFKYCSYFFMRWFLFSFSVYSRYSRSIAQRVQKGSEDILCQLRFIVTGRDCLVRQPLLDKGTNPPTTQFVQQAEEVQNTQEIKRTLLLIGQNRTKRVNFRGSPLFQATYNIKTENKQLFQLILCQLDVGGWQKEKGTRPTLALKFLMDQNSNQGL